MSNQANTSSILPRTPVTPSRDDSDESFEIDHDETSDLNEYFKNEQSKINAGLNFLMNFDSFKRKPGRPPKNNENKSSKKIPESVNSNLRQFTNINDLHPGVLIDHLNRLNSFNQKLLNSFNALNEKYLELDVKYSKLSEVLEAKCHLITTTNDDIQDESCQPDVSESSNSKTKSSQLSQSNVSGISELELKIDSLEQKSYSNILLMNGPIIDECVDSDNQLLVSNIKQKIREHIPEIQTDTIKQASYFGKSKKQIKLTCADSWSRNKILIEAKRKKSTTVFFSEYLTKLRNKLYTKLRSLKKSNSEKLTAVYTRDENIYYKLSTDKTCDYHSIRQFEDINNLETQLM